VSIGRTTTNHLSDYLANYPLIRHIITQYRLFAPLIALYIRLLAEEPRFYRVDDSGAIVCVVEGSRAVTNTITFSEVLEVGQYLFVGAPFSGGIFRVKLEGFPAETGKRFS
jgi:hypothetical protein